MPLLQLYAYFFVFLNIPKLLKFLCRPFRGIISARLKNKGELIVEMACLMFYIMGYISDAFVGTCNSFLCGS